MIAEGLLVSEESHAAWLRWSGGSPAAGRGRRKGGGIGRGNCSAALHDVSLFSPHSRALTPSLLGFHGVSSFVWRLWFARSLDLRDSSGGDSRLCVRGCRICNFFTGVRQAPRRAVHSRSQDASVFRARFCVPVHSSLVRWRQCGVSEMVSAVKNQVSAVRAGRSLFTRRLNLQLVLALGGLAWISLLSQRISFPSPP